MSTSWLNKHRKQTLIDLSAEAGLKQSDSLRKEEIVTSLHDHLQANSSRLSHLPVFEGYFSTRRSTPFKARESLAPADEPEVRSVVKARGRRATRVKQEDTDDDADDAPTHPVPTAAPILSPLTKVLTPLATTTSLIAKAISPRSPDLSPSIALHTATPGPRRRRSEVPGPASPSQIADAVEQSSARLADSLSSLYSLSGVSPAISRAREACSSVAGVQITVLALEALALQRSLIPFRYLGDLPAALPLAGASPVYYPDFFVLLTARYWGATLLWAGTGLVVPVIVAYFYNLTLRGSRRGGVRGERVLVGRYTADPLAYNVVRALGAWAVYQRGTSFGFIREDAVERVESAVLGGSNGIIIGSVVGILAALYEAALRKTA